MTSAETLLKRLLASADAIEDSWGDWNDNPCGRTLEAHNRTVSRLWKAVEAVKAWRKGGPGA